MNLKLNFNGIRPRVKFFFFSCIMFSSLYATSNTLAQPISFHLEQATFSSIVEEIESQTSYVFSFESGWLDLETKFDVAYNDMKIEDIIDDLSSKFRFDYKIDNTYIQITKKNLPPDSLQQITVKGHIYDEYNNPLPGATIIDKRTNQGVTSDFNGFFSISVDAGTVLLISYIGYKDFEIEVVNETELEIILETKASELNEIVVVGYGVQEKSSLTGAVSQIKSEDIIETKTANIEGALVGRIPGLTLSVRSGQPGEDDASILVRGRGTFGNANPLIVIDGVANRGNFSRLNSYDIESISVLKDASAAIYGAQSANGVIVVTTKKGKHAANGKPRVSVNSEYSLTQPTIKPNLMTAVQVLTWENERNVRIGSPPEFNRIIKGYEEGTLDPNEWGETDWWAYTTNKWSEQRRTSVSVDGGSESFSYYLSSGLLNQDAIFKNSVFGYDQFNFLANFDLKLSDNLDVGVSINGRQEKRINPLGDINGVIASIYTRLPYDLPRYSNGFLAETSGGSNPVALINGDAGDQQSTSRTYLNKVSFKLRLPSITDGLYLSGFGAYDIFKSRSRSLSKPYDIYSYSPNTGEYSNLKGQQGGVNLSENTRSDVLSTLQFQLGYDQLFGDHSIKFFAAYEQSKSDGSYLFASRNNLVSPELPSLDLGSEIDQRNGGSNFQAARQNYFGRLSYSYKNRYLVELTSRYDGSQNFPPGSRFGFFPGASVGWKISEEPSFKISWISNLKLRASVGILGNDRIAPFQYLQNYDVRSFTELVRGTGGYVEWYNRNVFGENKQVTQGLYPSSVPNPNVTWESATKANVAIDLSLFDGKFDFSADFFYDRREDILLPRLASVPEYAGFQLPDENLGIVNNKGFEVAMAYNNKVGDFNYFVNGQISYARNQIEFMDEAKDTPLWQRRTGQSIDFISGYQADGIYQNQAEIDASAHLPDAIPGDIKFKDIKEDGVIDAKDIAFSFLSPTPRYIYSFELGGSWKGLSLSAFFQGQLQAETMYRPWPLNQDRAFYVDRWISDRETPNATQPGAYGAGTNNSLGSTHWIRDNSFLRLKNVFLSYDLPDEIIKKLKIAQLRIFMNGSNLFLLQNNVEIFDPESTTDTGWYYPQQRVISTGLTLTF